MTTYNYMPYVQEAIDVIVSAYQSGLSSLQSSLNTCTTDRTHLTSVAYNGCLYSVNNLVTDTVNLASLYVQTRQAVIDTGGNPDDVSHYPFSLSSADYCTESHYSDVMNATLGILGGEIASGAGFGVTVDTTGSTDPDELNALCYNIIAHYTNFNSYVVGFIDVHNSQCCLSFDAC